MNAATENGYLPRQSLTTLTERLYATAYDALENELLAYAERYFALLALLAPRDERAWIGLAVVRERRGDWPMAAARYLLGSAFAPGSSWCHFGRARALRVLGRDPEAEQAFDDAEATADDPGLLELIAAERNAS